MKKTTPCILLLLACLPAGAQTVSDADAKLLDKLKQANTAYTTMTCRFKQTQHVAMLNGDDATSEGAFYYRKPHQLALKYSLPDGDLLLITADDFVMIAGEKYTRRAANSKAVQGMKAILSACLQGDLRLMDDADQIACSETANSYTVTVHLLPDSRRNKIRKATASYDKKTLALVALQTEEADGSYTRYELAGAQFNLPIDDAVFQTPKKSR